MYILAFFNDDGIPKTGLSPTIKIRDVSNGSLLINGASMAEVGDGFYRYDYTTYDYGKDYAIVCDGGISLSDTERYVYAGNESYVDDVTDGVWNEQTADHAEDGTFGGELATKADIAASTSTDNSSAISGSVIYGTQDSGTYISTNVKNNIYWEIEEDDGLTVELVFNIPDENRAGVFRAFGRYEGVPSTTHYMELWMYNYEASAWEQYQEIFLPGGNVSDAEYEQNYYERNIDRSNNNEVKVKLIHNVTTYITTHLLFLDFAEVTSIDIVTAAEIADAVWSKTSSGATDGSYGGLLQRVIGLMHENIYIDNPGYDNGGNLISARVRIYSDAGSVGTANNVIGTYSIAAPAQAPGQFTSWSQIRG